MNDRSTMARARCAGSGSHLAGHSVDETPAARRNAKHDALGHGTISQIVSRLTFLMSSLTTHLIQSFVQNITCFCCVLVY